MRKKQQLKGDILITYSMLIEKRDVFLYVRIVIVFVEASKLILFCFVFNKRFQVFFLLLLLLLLNFV